MPLAGSSSVLFSSESSESPYLSPTLVVSKPGSCHGTDVVAPYTVQMEHWKTLQRDALTNKGLTTMRDYLIFMILFSTFSVQRVFLL